MLSFIVAADVREFGWIKESECWSGGSTLVWVLLLCQSSTVISGAKSIWTARVALGCVFVCGHWGAPRFDSISEIVKCF